MDDKFRNRYRIESNRLKGWDYSSRGAYFVTVCVKDKIECFGRIENGVMKYSKIGLIVQDLWLEIPNHFSNSELDDFVIMPDHVHGIINMKYDCRDAINRVCTDNGGITGKFNMMPVVSIARIVRWFKGRCSYELRNKKINFYWLPRYYDRIIRNEDELNRIREYIRDNPKNWKK